MMSRRPPFLARVSAIALAFLLVLSTAAQAASFRIYNNGSHRIVSAWVSPSNSGFWGSDRLGADLLDPGYYLSVYVAGCYADIRLLYDDRQVATRYRFNTCTYNYESNF